jgi:hypothetical protein
MSIGLFISQKSQNQQCGICLSDDPKDLKELGPIFNHLVNKHPGFHKRCLKTWMKVQATCPQCRAPLNPQSLSKRKINVIDFPEMLRENPRIFTAVLFLFFFVIAGVEAKILDLSQLFLFGLMVVASAVMATHEPLREYEEAVNFVEFYP